MLVAAEFTDEEMLTLTFDRAIDVSGLDGTQILVDDSIVVGSLYLATGGTTMLTPASVRIAMAWVEGSTTPGLHLTAGAASGIVAIDDGGTWAGVTALELPFP